MSDTRVVRAFDVRVNSFGDNTILVRGQSVYELGDVEQVIWSLCDGEHSVGQIADAVVERFEVDRATALQDVADFVAELEHDRLVESVEP